jgi:hypothetical protein
MMNERSKRWEVQPECVAADTALTAGGPVLGIENRDGDAITFNAARRIDV